MEDQSAMYLRQIMDLEADVKKVPGLQKSVDELQSQVAKLEKEKVEVDETLKVKSNDITKLKTQLTASESGKKMYEEELAELQAQLDDDDGIPDEVSSPMAGMSLTSAKSVTDSKEKAMRLQIENRKLREQVETLKKSATGEGLSAAAAVAASTGGMEGESGTQLKAEVTRLKQELQKKEAEKEKLGSDKEKLEAYTKRTLSKFQEKYLVALQECKAKLKEKHDKIEALEMRSASEKTAQKREERLLSSTIYELGLAIMQQRLKER
jgi:protein HOOK3